MRRQRTAPLADCLREVIRASGITQTELSRRTKIPQPNLSQFLNDKAGITLDTADRLLEAMDLRVSFREGVSSR